MLRSLMLVFLVVQSTTGCLRSISSPQWTALGAKLRGEDRRPNPIKVPQSRSENWRRPSPNFFTHHRASVCPRIVSRAEWGANAPKSRTAIGRPIPKVFIHHTASGSCTRQADCSRLVKQFQIQHQNDNGWADIGYNFLVGQDGNVYEGRGWDLVGAHAKKWNSVSLSISVIGNFAIYPPNSAAQNTVKQLIDCGIRQRKLCVSYTLHGHRDGCPTSCPGNAFYNLIKTWPRYGGSLSSSC